MAVTTFLFPGDFFHPHRPDDHFLREADAVLAAGAEVQVIDHDALVEGRADDAVRRVHGAGPSYAVYRGWMVTAEQYQALNVALVKRGVCIRTSPEQYRLAHELPGWYRTFQEMTPRSAWSQTDDPRDAALFASHLPYRAGVVKDYVKSAKHLWETAMHLPDLTDVEACQVVIGNFIEQRGSDLTGGIVIREFEQFQPGEARTWWIEGQCYLRTAHPDSPDEVLDVPDEVIDRIGPAVRALGSPFVTVDVARTSSGEFRVVEVGDGQVSDLPSTVDPVYLIAMLAI